MEANDMLKELLLNPVTYWVLMAFGAWVLLDYNFKKEK